MTQILWQLWTDFMLWELITPWGTFSIGLFDGYLFWMVLVSVAAVTGPFITAKSRSTAETTPAPTPKTESE